jgi:hypothetical protein
MPAIPTGLRRPPYCWCIGFAMVGVLERDFMRRTGRPIIKRPPIFGSCDA